jgi:hypothetical protein
MIIKINKILQINLLFQTFLKSTFHLTSNRVSMLSKEPQIPQLSIYYVTVDSIENANKIADALLQQKLIACANLIGSQQNPITSTYTWKGNIEKS